MKTKSKPHFWTMAVIVAIFAAATWSCNKSNDPTLTDLRADKISYLADSIRISDSLKRVNGAGIVNYAITVVSGSTSTLFKSGIYEGRSAESKSAVDGAIVTISQFGKVVKDTTDASGMVVFSGFFRTSVNVTIEKAGFTKVSYISVVNKDNSTDNGGVFFVGNLVPLFELTGANTATISGKATIQTNLTNKTRELVPDGTTVSASIDATNINFANMFLTNSLYDINTDYPSQYVGHIIEASYSTGIIGTVTAGNYTVTVPAAIDGLPLKLQYSDLAIDQTLFEFSEDGDPFNQTVVYRTIYEGNVTYTPSGISPAGSVSVGFSAGSDATATAVISSPETVDRINVTNGGTGYSGTPLVTLTGGGGTGATATAVVTNGVVTGFTLTSAGVNYTTAPTLNLISGSGATASSTLSTTGGTVTGVAITNSGVGYTAGTPTVNFSAPTGTGTLVTATGTANLDAAGRVTSITITNAGSGYIADPTVALGAAPAGGVSATANGIFSGLSISSVSVTGGSNYTYAPSVTFSQPQRANGTVATGTATFDPTTRQVTGINITNAGSGYTIAPPTITLNAGAGASGQALLSGGSVLSANIANQGFGYVGAPIVQFTGSDGTGAAGTAVIIDGKVIGINITNGGTGYTTPPTIALLSGDGAQAFASVNAAGGISGVTIVNGGSNFTGAPRVTFSSVIGGGATGTATVAGGQVTGVTVNAAGTGYVEGNVPSGLGEAFSATKGRSLTTKIGIKYINDVYYGTGVRQPR